MEYQNILFEIRDGVGVITINRPKNLNALNEATLEELGAVLEDIRTGGLVRVVVLTGSGEKAFVAGADITNFPSMNPLKARLFSEKGQQVFARLEELPIPTIACVNGFALGGGCELAMSCDFIYASDRAKFGQPEIHLGLIPGFGGTQRLARLIGRARAKELCMTGERIDAQKALELGLAAKVFPAEKLFEETMKVASLIASRGWAVLRSIKYVIDRGMDVDLRNGCALEAEAFGNCFAGADFKEGVSAFLEKREPKFKGSLEE